MGCPDICFATHSWECVSSGLLGGAVLRNFPGNVSLEITEITEDGRSPLVVSGVGGTPLSVRLQTAILAGERVRHLGEKANKRKKNVH